MRVGERVYRTLREEILDGELTPGSVLTEVGQATRLGVSRTPVREAFGRLGSDGLLRAATGRTQAVTGVSRADILSLYELREALEAPSARLAAERRDREVFARLHERFTHAAELVDQGADGLRRYYALVDDLDVAIGEAAGNAYLQQALGAVRLHSGRVRRSARQNPHRLKEAAAEHQLIIGAIRDGDGALAEHATYVHLRLSRAHALGSAEGSGEAAPAGGESLPASAPTVSRGKDIA